MKLLLLAVCVASAFAQRGGQCSKDEYSLNTRDFLNELGDLITEQYGKIRSGRMSYLREINTNITRAFSQGGCGNRWSSSYGESDRRQWLYQFLQGFTTSSGKRVPQDVVNLAKKVEEYIWMIGKDHVFATCVATHIRDNLVHWMATGCGEMRGEFNFIQQGLNDFPIARYAGDPNYETDLRAAIMLLARAYLTATKCGGVSNTQRVIRQMNKQTEEDFCWAAADAYIKDSCYNEYKDNCPKVIRCVNRLVDDFDSAAKEVFGGKGEVIKDAKDCIRKSNDYWKGKKPNSVPGVGTVLADGLKLWSELKKVKNSLTSAERDEAAEYLKAIIKAHFRTEACDCENVNR